MKALSIVVGGIVAGLLIIAGEAVLNLVILAHDWVDQFARFALPDPTVGTTAQGVLKLLLLGIFSVWLADAIKQSFPRPGHAGVVSGLCLWLLVWAWVQWGMVLAGYVTARIAVLTVLWGLWELPLAVWIGTSVGTRLNAGPRT
jgi:hypothetical protein